MVVERISVRVWFEFSRRPAVVIGLIVLVLALLLVSTELRSVTGQEPVRQAAVDPFPLPEELQRLNLLEQSAETARQKSIGCVQCHKDAHDPHKNDTRPQPAFHLGCVDCHGGDASTASKERAHVAPRFPQAWPNSANPVRSYALLNHERPEFVRFVNPGDLRIGHLSCGLAGCHSKEVFQNRMSMMTHGCMLWGAALYNNGSVPNKWARYGESYSMNGVPQRLQTYPPPTEHEMAKKGVIPYLDPLPRYEMTQPGNILRIFERGGRFRPEIGIPERLEESGKPRARLSDRGLGTQNRTDPVFIGLQRTRLFDPTLNFLGTNDHPGDYRSSGCTACHVLYANDRSKVHSGSANYKFGNRGLSANPDPTIPKDEPGHPIKHEFTRAIPTSQCIVCHVHPGTNVMNSYLGYMWWDEETDGHLMYPSRQKYPTAEEFSQAAMNNPDEASARGLWGDPRFLERITDLNPHLKHSQFADFHGHGWVFRAVYKKDRHGNFLDHRGTVVAQPTTAKLAAALKVPEQVQAKQKCQKDGLPVHLMDIHLEKGMHCIDCHFVQDVHGNGKLYGEVRAAIEIQCIDCHGTIGNYANLKTSGPAAADPPRDLETFRTPWGKRRFEKRADDKGRPVLVQNSMVEKGRTWTVPQVKDVIDPDHPRYNEKARLAKTVRFKANSADLEWGDVPFDKDGKPDEAKCAHANKNMSCIACHSAWNPSCFGCHLPQKANKRMPTLHFEGEVNRNHVAYNFQTLRDDVFMLAKDGDVTGNRTGPARSSCAIHVGSYNQNRDSIYVQQQTISAEGMSGIAFSTNVPHTVRGGPPLSPFVPGAKTNGRPLHPDINLHPGRAETKSCTDCHLSKKDDNNAIMAQLLMHGTGYVNFMGRYCWVAAKDHGLHAVVVTELEEPQAVIGSTLHKLAFPDFFQKHARNKFLLTHVHEHPGIDIGDKLRRPFKKPEILQVQPRGEFLYAACGEDGVRIFDIAFIDNKSFSERITTAPVSPQGQQFFVKTAYALAVAAPCTMAPDPTRTQKPENREGKVHPLYGYIYVADKHEGLILIGAGSTLDGNPTNNFLQREVTFNPDGILRGARNVTIVGSYAYVCCDAGLAVVSLDNPKTPRITSILQAPDVVEPRAIAVQFRYAYVCDKEGIKILDVTDLARPRLASYVTMPDARNIYLARTYAYVAAGKNGLVILDIERPAHPKLDQVYNAGGVINDLEDVKLGITYVSEFAYLADGKNGLRVVQLTSPETPGNQGFSPRPTPQLIATYKIPHGGQAISIGRALDRDRAVDESGNQLGVFGRVGARPFTFQEQQQLYLRNGRPWFVSDDPEDMTYGPPRPPQRK